MNDVWTVLVTGPVSGMDRWCAAASEAGWNAVPYPLLEVRTVEGVEVIAPDSPLPDWIAITSSNALPALAQALAARPDLAGVRFVAVGQATAEEAVSLGLPEPMIPAPGAQDAQGLARTLTSNAARGDLVLWPRGDRAQELGNTLRASGLEVQDPVVYRTEMLPMSAEPPHTDVVFFASPSAVEAWNAPERAFAPAAVAIGWTTFEALGEVEDYFSMRIPLVTPSLHAFQDCLRSFVPAE